MRKWTTDVLLKDNQDKVQQEHVYDSAPSQYQLMQCPQSIDLN